jgi:SH3-like domain-containing protein
MRRSILLLTLCLCSTATAAEFPYTAYVNSADVYVRSGPGKNYYPTEKLQKGEKVEVYRHDPGGWLAIRPPQGSFSWVSARQLEPTKKGLAKSKDDRVVCRVGSTFSDVRDVIQVRLNKAEVVEILGDGGAQGAWYKIAPPAGEFRWIYGKFVDHHSSGLAASGAEGTESVAAKTADSAVGATSSRSGSEIKLASATEPIAPSAKDVATALSGEPARLSPILTEADLQKQLDAIEVELSSIVAEEVTVWSFDRLKEKAELALDGAQSAIDRGRARTVLAKIEKFQELKRRHEDVSKLAEETDRRSRQLGGIARRAAEAPRFDSAGRLTPVVSRKPGAPQYALVDANGAVVSFLTPAPGVNLRHYLDKQVGVNGPRGFMTDVQKQHVNVQRVTLLDVKR